MPTFTDSEGRRWTLEITLQTARRIRNVREVDFVGTDALEVVHTVISDAALLCDVLFLIVEDEAKERGVSDEDFGRALGGDTLEAATRAFCEAIRDFTPNPLVRERVGKLLAMIWETFEQENQKLQQDLAAAEKDLRQALQQSLSGNTPTNSPESLESTPHPSA